MRENRISGIGKGLRDKTMPMPAPSSTITRRQQTMQNRKILTISMLSMSLVALELVWTRIFSAEYFYTFTFLILSLAILGLGLGALSLRLFYSLNRGNLLGIALSLTGLMAGLGPPLILKLRLDFTVLFNDVGMLLRFSLSILVLTSAFFFGGMALAQLLKSNSKEIHRLYMGDMIGAGLGVVLVIMMMNRFGTPVSVFLSAVPVLISAIIESTRFKRTLPILFLAGLVLLTARAERLLQTGRAEIAPVIYKHWDALAQVKVHEVDEEFRIISIDNAAKSPVTAFDGVWNNTGQPEFQFLLDTEYLIARFDSCVFLSVGAGGGADVLQALQYGAREIHAVEVNSQINHLMVDGLLAGFTGHIYRDHRVKVITEDARTYLRRFKNKFDVILALSANSFSAFASGGFALAENYLFTTEAFLDYWEALTENGFLVVEHRFYVPRLVSQVVEALGRKGVKNIGSHFAVYDLPKLKRKVLLVSKQPLSPDILRNAFFWRVPDYCCIDLVYPAIGSSQNNLITSMVEKGWRIAADQAGFDISPCTDNRPYTPQMGMWKNFSFAKLHKALPYEFTGFPVSKLTILFILSVLIMLVLPLNLLPYLKEGRKLRIVPWFYFFTIGMAFMMVEIILIQKYTLFVGASVYSLGTILVTLLVSSGIGSRYCQKVKTRTAFLGIVIWLLLDIFVFRHLFYTFVGFTMFIRILVTVLLVMPLGFFMGMPFPKGGLKAGDLIDWGFAVNGAGSVMGSALILLIAFSYGFMVALGVSGLLYLVAYYLLSLESAW